MSRPHEALTGTRRYILASRGEKPCSFSDASPHETVPVPLHWRVGGHTLSMGIVLINLCTFMLHCLLFLSFCPATPLSSAPFSALSGGRARGVEPAVERAVPPERGDVQLLDGAWGTTV